jgi:hypothetical protein
MDWNKALSTLRDAMATADLHTRQSSKSTIEFLVKQYQTIKLRMDGNLNHQRPHIHIDYGKEHHVASYAIDNGKRLAGNLDNKYDKQVRA